MLHNLSEKIKSGETVIGAFVFMNDVGAAEVLSYVGYDFLLIDMEHSPTDFGNLRSLIMAVEDRCAPVVRARSNNPAWITAVLDMGAAAVMIPSVNTVEQARAAVDAAKYSPIGHRGIGCHRVSEYGDNRQRVIREANEKQLLWLQCESLEAVGNSDAISKVPGVDLLFVGLSDLSQSCGCTDNTSSPIVVDNAVKAVRTGVGSGLPVGVGTGENMRFWRDAGANVFVVGADFAFLRSGAKQVLDKARASA